MSYVRDGSPNFDVSELGVFGKIDGKVIKQMQYLVPVHSEQKFHFQKLLVDVLDAL